MTGSSSVFERLFKALIAMVLLSPALAQDARVCAACHPRVWETYRKTGMAQSFHRIGKGPVDGDLEQKTAYYHAPSDSYFLMLKLGDTLFQRRYQLDSSGKQINVMEKSVDYVMGSGNHARTYLHRTATGTLTELPLGWYAEKGGYWAMNPGYDRANHDGFRRPITYDCMFCHNAYPRVPAGQDQPFADAVYDAPLLEGIDCTRCHGSAARHLQLAGRPGVKKEEVRASILNPARLSGTKQMEICMSCHLETTSFPLPNALRRFGRTAFSYQPGEPLGNFIVNFDHAVGTGRDDKFEIVNAAYRLRRSACFLKSQGKMLCTTCHDPHDAPRGVEAERHYTAVCRQCHAGPFDLQVKGGLHPVGDNCTDCHMPKRRTEDVIHVAVTDHFIQRQRPAGDLLAERAERQDVYRGPVVPYYPETLPASGENKLLLAVAQVIQNSSLTDGIRQLTEAIQAYRPKWQETYLELADALQNAGERERALGAYRDAVRVDPKSVAGLEKLGTALRHAGRHAEAVAVLERSASLAPARATSWHELALGYHALGKTGDAVTAFQKAIELDPDLAEAQNNLGNIWMEKGEPVLAEGAFREAIRIRPEYADAHANLAVLLSQTGKFAQAREEYERTLRQHPSDVPTRYHFAVMLGQGGQVAEAQRELEECLRTDPLFTEAHLVLGDLLMAQGMTTGAAPHYREALGTKPDSARAHFGLAAVLLKAGDVKGAIVHLKEAAASGDAAMRERVADLLRQISAGK